MRRTARIPPRRIASPFPGSSSGVGICRAAFRRIYLNPPSSGRIMRWGDDPSATSPLRRLNQNGMRNDGCRRVSPIGLDKTATSFAEDLRAVAKLGSERAWVSFPRKRGPFIPSFFRYSQMAWVMARMILIETVF